MKKYQKSYWVYVAPLHYCLVVVLRKRSLLNSATDEQLTSSSKATEALLWAMPAFVNDYKTWNAGDYDWGIWLYYACP